MKPKLLTAISIFSGAGGFDLGVESAGFDTRLCTDIDYHSCKTLRLNRRRGKETGLHSFLKNSVVLQADIRKTSSEKLLRAARLQKGEVSLLIGGPPCQSFSVFGLRQGMEDPRGSLLWDYIRILRETQPEGFIFENVAGLLSIDNGRTYEQFLRELQRKVKDVQYTVRSYLLDVSHYGVPQYRSRIIIFGNRNGVAVSEPPRTHYQEEVRSYKNLLDLVDNHNGHVHDGLLRCPTVVEALWGLPEPSENSQIPNHTGREHSARIIERYQQLEFGERDSKTRINKLHPYRQSYTIIVGSDKGGGKGHVHPFEPREVTPRESARLQTFPDFWEFTGTSRHPIRQVGNAVPPVFAATLAYHAKKEMFGIDDNPGWEEILRKLQLDYLIEGTKAGPQNHKWATNA